LVALPNLINLTNPTDPMNWDDTLVPFRSCRRPKGSMCCAPFGCQQETMRAAA
jgi:hypothetical protein